MENIPLTLDLVRGIAELEPATHGLLTHRLPAAVRERYPDPQLLAMERQPSGARIALRTAATTLELETHSTRIAYIGADRPRGCIDVLVDGALVTRERLTGGDAVVVDLRAGTTEQVLGETHRTVLRDLPAGRKTVEFWLPHNEEIQLVALRADAPVEPVATRADPAGPFDGSPESPVGEHVGTRPVGRPLWLHYGSSISQGSNAASPTQIWPVVAALDLDVELRSLGLGGSALVDPFIARMIRDAPADVISLEIGINVVNTDAFRLRTFVAAVHGFLDTIREGHPNTPIHLMTPFYCGIQEDTPGPGAIDPASLGTSQVRFIATGQKGDTEFGRLTLEVIRDALADVVDHRPEDPHLHLMDGLALYGASDAVDHPLPDALHPDTATHGIIGTRFAEHLREAGATE